MITGKVKLQYGFVDDWFIYAKDEASKKWYMMNTETSPLWLSYGFEGLNLDREPNSIEKYIVPLIDWDKEYLADDDLSTQGWEKVGSNHIMELNEQLYRRARSVPHGSSILSKAQGNREYPKGCRSLFSTPSRIQRKRGRGWRMPRNTVYVGRPTKWSNPLIIGAAASVLTQLGFFS
jgi:hypothetical protein